MGFLTIEGLTKCYESQVSVDSFTLDVAKGEFVTLLGPSGCGKSTTLQMIAGFVEPTKGTIWLAGKDLTNVHPSKRGLGIVFQSYALFPHMTAAENVEFGLQMRRVARSERAKQVDEVLELVGLAKYRSRYPRQMSGGQQQRVALARALVVHPDVLLLDEPLSNLDAKLREGMQEELRHIQSHFGTTTIMVTHDQAEALALSDRVVVMSEGKIEQIDFPERVYDAPSTPFVASFLGKTNELPSFALAQLGVSTSPMTFIRPEKFTFSNSGLAGTVKSRMFLGTQWQYQIETAFGVVTMTRPHDGEWAPVRGAAVHLRLTEADRTRAGVSQFAGGV
jgi:putative spermidine/putrescine transport system ATP-binding protein